VITLQHSLLPALPKVEGLQLAARYLVGVDGNQVGGDWYDVLPLPDGAVGVAVGDVVGHDLRAAAAMGQLRGVLRSYAWDGGGPGSVLDRCDQLVQGLEMAAMATAVYARIEPPADDGSRLVRYANAGHPAPLLLAPDGGLRRLDEQRSPMIGAVRDLGRRAGAGHTEAQVRCAPGSLLLLYTDGFTDIAGEDADERRATGAHGGRPPTGRLGRGRGRTRGRGLPSRCAPRRRRAAGRGPGQPRRTLKPRHSRIAERRSA
jgi:serine phosphatase RsbU (regulator of sigma subunit)